MNYIASVQHKAPYRLIATLLSLSILIGISLPSGLHAMSGEICNMTEDMRQLPMPDHGDDCPMEISAAAEMQHSGTICSCNIDQAPLKTEVPAHKKPVLFAFPVELGSALVYHDQTDSKKHFFTVSDAFEPPPIYLTNASFLN